VTNIQATILLNIDGTSWRS